MIQACGDPALILVDDADERPDLRALLEDLAAWPGGSTVRVLLTARAPDARALIARSLEPRHRSLANNAPERHVDVFGTADDHARWLGEAVRAYAKARRTPPPDLPASASRGAASESDEPILTVQTQAP